MWCQVDKNNKYCTAFNFYTKDIETILKPLNELENGTNLAINQVNNKYLGLEEKITNLVNKENEGLGLNIINLIKKDYKELAEKITSLIKEEKRRVLNKSVFIYFNVYNFDGVKDFKAHPDYDNLHIFLTGSPQISESIEIGMSYNYNKEFRGGVIVNNPDYPLRYLINEAHKIASLIESIPLPGGLPINKLTFERLPEIKLKLIDDKEEWKQAYKQWFLDKDLGNNPQSAENIDVFGEIIDWGPDGAPQ